MPADKWGSGKSRGVPSSVSWPDYFAVKQGPKEKNATCSLQGNAKDIKKRNEELEGN